MHVCKYIMNFKKDILLSNENLAGVYQFLT